MLLFKSCISNSYRWGRGKKEGIYLFLLILILSISKSSFLLQPASKNAVRMINIDVVLFIRLFFIIDGFPFLLYYMMKISIKTLHAMLLNNLK